MPRSVYIIDGHAQIYRAYFAPFGNLSSPTGEPTRATHVFSQMLLNLVRDRKPDYLITVLDTSDETVFRREIYSEYKAHRDPSPEDMQVQIERIISIIHGVGIPTLRVPGFEADDIIATLARRLADADTHVYIVSRDKDLDQLLNENVTLYDPTRDEDVTPARLFELKGWRPEQAIDAQTLIGDSTDNVPGVPGIGPKTAAKLLEKYGSAAGVFAHADELTPKQRENVLAFMPLAERTRLLVTLRTDVPVELDLERAAVAGFRWSAAQPIFRELGFRRLVEQLPGTSATAAEPAPAGEPPALLGDEPPAPPAGAEYMPRPASAAIDVQLAQRLSRPDGGDYRMLSTPEELAELARALADQPALAVDTETTGVSPIDAELVGLSLSWELGRAVYVPIRSIYGRPPALELVRAVLGPILADARKLKIGHNIKYDMIVLEQAGLPLGGPLFDTMIAAFALDPLMGSYKMDSIVQRLLAHTMIPITDLIGKGRDQLRMDQVPLDQITQYAAEDADYTWRMQALFAPALQGSDLHALFYQTEMPLVRVLARMETNGISVDAGFLGEMSRTLARRVDALTDEAHAIAGQKFNLDSPKQLGEILFDKLQMRVVRRTRTTRSTDAETLEALAGETGHPLLRVLLEFRELQKLRGTYVDALPAARSRRTGRVHTSYHQTGAITGRLSSSEPNLQNVPIRTELGRQIRKAFVPRTSDELLIAADYSQIELRVLAHYCEDQELIRAFHEDRDIHAFVAAQINNVPLEAVTREMRGRAKAVNFGLIYGQTAFGLAQGTGMGRGEAQAFIDAYFRRYPRIRGFINQCIADARRDGFVRTIQGRKRPIPDVDSRNRALRAQAERLAVNTIIQGSAADLIKIAMIRLDARITAENLPLRMLLQVHDELVCEAPRSARDSLCAIVAEVMSGAIALRVPLKVDVCAADNWLDAK